MIFFQEKHDFCGRPNDFEFLYLEKNHTVYFLIIGVKRRRIVSGQKLRGLRHFGGREGPDFPRPRTLSSLIFGS